jgi:hypothetical protein
MIQLNTLTTLFHYFTMSKISLRSYMWCCVNNFFIFINAYDPHLILLYVIIGFSIYIYIFFHYVKNTLTTPTHSLLYVRNPFYLVRG